MARFQRDLPKNFPLLVTIALVVLTLPSLFFDVRFGTYAIAYFGFGSLLIYASAIVSFVLVLRPDKKRRGKHADEIGAVLLAAAWSAFMIIWFAFGWRWFAPQLSDASACNDTATVDMCLATKAIYFSAVTFTSTGYGDVLPVTLPARWCAAIEAFVGHVNALVFFGLLFSRVERWRNASRRNQKRRSNQDRDARTGQLGKDSPAGRNAARIRAFKRRTIR